MAFKVFSAELFQYNNTVN